MVIEKSGGGTAGGGQVVGKKVAPVKQAIAQIKAGHVKNTAITVQFMFVVHHYFKSLSTSWPLPKNYHLAAPN